MFLSLLWYIYRLLKTPLQVVLLDRATVLTQSHLSMIMQPRYWISRLNILWASIDPLPKFFGVVLFHFTRVQREPFQAEEKSCGEFYQHRKVWIQLWCSKERVFRRCSTYCQWDALWRRGQQTHTKERLELFEVAGMSVGHSIIQQGPGIPCISQAVYDTSFFMMYILYQCIQ